LRIPPDRINKPGGCGKITDIHFGSDGTTIESLDVKYIVGVGAEKELDPALVFPYRGLDRGGRNRRGRDFFGEVLINGSSPRPRKTASKIVNNKENDSNIKIRDQGDPKLSKDSKKLKKTIQLKKLKERAAAHHQPSSNDTSPPTAKKTKVAKEVTPIPTYILAGEDIDVSPLMASASKDKPSSSMVNQSDSVVSRANDDGFMPSTADTVAAITQHKNLSKSLFQGTGDDLVTPDKKSTYGSFCQKNTNSYSVTKTTGLPGAPSATHYPEMATTPSPTLDLVQQRSGGSLAPGLDLLLLAKNRLQNSDDSKLPAKKRFLARKLGIHTPTLTVLPQHANNSPLREENYKALQQVYEGERKKALQFMEEVCGARDEDILPGNSPKTSPLSNEAL
jgi:hypothetical protein